MRAYMRRSEARAFEARAFHASVYVSVSVLNCNVYEIFVCVFSVLQCFVSLYPAASHEKAIECLLKANSLRPNLRCAV